jgi:hypothetical protein
MRGDVVYEPFSDDENCASIAQRSTILVAGSHVG